VINPQTEISPLAGSPQWLQRIVDNCTYMEAVSPSETWSSTEM